MTLEVLFAPAEFAALPGRGLKETMCVVFDVFRATSTIVTALNNGASAVIPVSEIPEAIALRNQHPEFLLAGEREGLRIRANLTGGIDFDFGNSPREFTRDKVQGHTLVLSTTNGSRAMRACSGAKEVLAGAFLNLRATAEYLLSNGATSTLVVCAGTFDQAALEDSLAAGALVEQIAGEFPSNGISDSAKMALELYQQNKPDISRAAGRSRNGRRLLENPDLRDDVGWCLQRDIFSFAARLQGDAIARVNTGRQD